MKRFKILFILTGLMLFVFAISVPNVHAADKTISVKIAINPDFWNSKITFPNGNKTEISGIGIIVLDKGIPQVFKTLTTGQNDLSFTYTGEEGADYQIKIPFWAGPGNPVYQTIEKVKNNGQTLTYTIGVDTSIRPLTIELMQQ